MYFQYFIGIDVSKSHLDVFLYPTGQYQRFINHQKGFRSMIDWLKGLGLCSYSDVLFGLEHTGLYSLPVSKYLNAKGYKFTLLGGLQLKRSRGIVRGKSDKMDAQGIAEYIYEKKEKIKCYVMPSKTVIELKKLVNYRNRLVKERAGMKMSLHEYQAFLTDTKNAVMLQSLERMITQLTEEIKHIQAEISRLLKQDKTLQQQFDLITSIKSIGPQTALMMIILTHGFTQFDSWRKFASYAGTAPFPNQSGNSKGKTKISYMAHKQMKSLLSNCAVSAIKHNPEIRMYYQRRVAEGKHPMNAKNIVKNKLIARVFAVIKRQTPYVETFKFAA